MKKSNIAIIKTDQYFYPESRGLRPNENYPESVFPERSHEKNHVYDMVRDGFQMLGYDRSHYDSSDWNPLEKFIAPGDTVVIKPNLVMDQNHIKENGTDCLYTNPSLVAAVIDYVFIALKGKGEIVVGDAPMQECDFENLLTTSGYDKLISYYTDKAKESEIQFSFIDFRDLKSERINGINRSEVTALSKGITVDLDMESEFVGESDDFYDNLRITNYNPDILKQHHNRNKNEYYVNTDVLKADVFINMPKPKTHRKAGVTIALKNIVGINTRKEYLPHHTNGAKEEGGDEYLQKSLPKRILDKLYDKRNYYMQTAKSYKKAWVISKFIRIIYEIIERDGKDKYYEGSWYGNDTISRTIVDLNKLLFYANKDGIICNTIQRKYLTIADMIISGEKEGPVAPTPKNVGIIAIGENPVCFDEAIMTLMGAKKEYIHTIRHARDPKGKLKLVDGEEPYLLSNVPRWDEKTLDDLSSEDLLHFEPTSGWKEAFESTLETSV